MKAKTQEILGIVSICAILALLVGLFIANLAENGAALY
jgi:hypothetical protein